MSQDVKLAALFERRRDLREKLTETNVAHNAAARVVKEKLQLLNQAKKNLEDFDRKALAAQVELDMIQNPLGQGHSKKRPQKSKLTAARIKANNAQRRAVQYHDAVSIAEREYSTALAKRDGIARESARLKSVITSVKQSIAARQSERVAEDAICRAYGVPKEYWGNITFRVDEMKNIHLYFGKTVSDIPGRHAHYVIDASGVLTYRREPGEPHGPQNFTKEGRGVHEVKELQIQQNTETS